MTIDLHTRRHKYNDMKKKKKYWKRTNYLDTKAKAKVKNGFGWFLATNHHTFQYTIRVYTFEVLLKKKEHVERGRTELKYAMATECDMTLQSVVRLCEVDKKQRKCANKTRQNGVKNQKLVHWFHSFIRFFSRLNFHWKIYPVKCQQKWNKKGNRTCVCADEIYRFWF